MTFGNLVPHLLLSVPYSHRKLNPSKKSYVFLSIKTKSAKIEN